MKKKSDLHAINFLRGVPSEEALSHLIPMVSEGYEKAIRKYGTEVLQYGHFTGFEPLRDLIGNLHNVNPKRVVVGNGGLEVISLFFKTLPRESNIIVEEASYDRVLIDANNYGHNIIGVKLSQEGVDLNHLLHVVDKVPAAAYYGIPFHQNPTGIVYTEENRKAVERVCREKKILCLWDVCYQDLRYDGKTNDPIDVSEWGPILASSFTKTISPGTKCGYIIVPEYYVEHLTKVVINTRINPNLPTQAFIADFIESGRYNEYLNYLHKLYKPRMDVFNRGWSTLFPGTYPVTITGGFFAPLFLEGISSDQEASFIKCARDSGVGIAAAWDAVAPNFKEEMRKKGLYIRLTFPAFEPDNIEWGLSKLKEAVELFV